MLFTLKFKELHSQNTYLRQQFEQRRAQTTYLSLAKRLEQRINRLLALDKEITQLQDLYTEYHTIAKHDPDKWKAFFSGVRAVATELHEMRTIELPVYISFSQNDHLLGKIYHELHEECNLTPISPIATLHQSQWFSVIAVPIEYPLYYSPASVLSNPIEIALIFHEVGHVLFRLWPDLQAEAGKILDDYYEKKRVQLDNEVKFGTLRNAARNGQLLHLDEWVGHVERELEETLCDIVGTLLGGPAYSAAFAVAFLANERNPFSYDHSKIAYLPLDYRMRLGSILASAQGHQNLSDLELDSVLAHINDGWLEVQQYYLSDKPHSYDWLYDEYLMELSRVVSAFLTCKGVRLYAYSCGRLREELNRGAVLQFTDLSKYDTWSQDLSDELQNSPQFKL